MLYIPHHTLSVHRTSKQKGQRGMLEGLTVSVEGLGAVDPQVQLADQQPLEAQQQVQRGRALLAHLLRLLAAGDTAGHVLQPGDGLGRHVPVAEGEPGHTRTQIYIYILPHLDKHT